MTDADRPWQVLLLGGASGVGKTTLSTALARHFGVSVTQLDDFQTVLMTMSTPDQQPALYFWQTNWDEFAAWSAEQHLAHAIGLGRDFQAALAAVVGDHLDEGTPVVLEGDFLLPELATRSAFDGQANQSRVRGLFVYEPDERQIMANYASREPGDQSLRAHRSWLHSEWLRNECDRRGVPAIAARPWDTVLDRAVEAIGS